MKPVQTADIAEAIANIAIAMGNASTLTIADRSSAAIVEMFTKQLRAQNISVELQHTNEGYLRGEIQQQVLRILKGAQQSLTESALPSRFFTKMARIIEMLSDEHFDGVEAKTRLEELVHDLVAELSEPMFLQIDQSKRQLYEQPVPLFGALVATKFADSSRDIAAAGRCLALNEWTACVFHLMRALEAPLQVFAKRVGVVFPSPTELENWKSIVDQMASKVEAEVKKLEGTPKSHARNEELQFLGDVALDFRHFKNAWRNDVAHGREWYDERDAERVYTAVKHFMQKMAEIA